MIKETNRPASGRVYYLGEIEKSQLDKIEGILGAEFATSARYYAAGKNVYTSELSPEIKERLKDEGFKSRSGVHLVL